MVEALIIRIGFLGGYIIIITRNPQNSIGNYLGRYSKSTLPTSPAETLQPSRVKTSCSSSCSKEGPPGVGVYYNVGDSENRGTVSWGPYNKDPTFKVLYWGLLLETPICEG